MTGCVTRRCQRGARRGAALGRRGRGRDGVRNRRRRAGRRIFARRIPDAAWGARDEPARRVPVEPRFDRRRCSCSALSAARSRSPRSPARPALPAARRTPRRTRAPHAATKTVYVAAQTARCVGVVPRDCLQVRTAPNEPWQLRHGGIEGFDYRPGDAYLLEIAAYRTPNPPADGSSVRWVLERVVRRQPRQARRRAAQRETNTRTMRKRHMRNA